MNVNQSSPPFFGGISQQPSYEMNPGCLSDILNGYPDITYGLRKRPGLRYQFSLDETTNVANAYWFAVAQTDGFPVLGCIIPGQRIRLWNLTTSQELTFGGDEDDWEYLTQNDIENTTLNHQSYKVISIQNAVIVLNRNVTVDRATETTEGTLTGTVTTYADLASLTPEAGQIYRITNAPNATEDDYYVQFNDGAWEETVRPGISVGIDSSTMPHVLIINFADSTYRFIEGDNVDREVGDLTSNPDPSFVGARIHNLFFYLNRLGYLSRDNVFLSQPLRPDNTLQDAVQSPNYYNNSALVQSPADPIDVNCASVRPVTLSSIQPTYQGLILFSDFEQFLLYSEQGAITPLTAIVKSISTYELNDFIDAVEMGDEYFFVSKTQRNTRVFKMVSRGLEQGPMLTDVGKIITDYIPNNVTDLVPNSQNQFISLSSKDDNKMYIYRVYRDDGQILFRAWFTWDLPGNIQTCAFFDDRMFVVLESGGRTNVLSAALNLVPEEDVLTNVPFPDGFMGPGQGVGPFLDYWISDATPLRFTITYSREYTDSEGVQWVDNPILTMPDNYPANLTLTPCVVKSQEALTLFTTSAAAEGTGQVLDVIDRTDQAWTIRGTFRRADATAFVAGYRFNYDLTFPTTYFRTEKGYDYTAYTNIARYKFAFKETDELSFLIQQLGREDWTSVKPSTPAGYYVENTFPYLPEVIYELPVNQRNTSFNMRLISDTPFPCTLSSMQWEGIYSPKYYRRT